MIVFNASLFTGMLLFGVAVWMELMLPCLGVRSVAAYPVEYVEKLFV
jgi:hypothetical protein